MPVSDIRRIERIPLDGLGQALFAAVKAFVEEHPLLEVGLRVHVRQCAAEAPWNGHDAVPDIARFDIDVDGGGAAPEDSGARDA